MSTHWKTLQNPNYLGAYSLMATGTAQDIIVRFSSVAKKLVKGEDGKDDDVIVAEIVGQKPMILNATNCKTLQKLFGSPMVEDWTTKPVTLFVAKVRAFGDTVDALRIRPAFPVITLPDLNPKHEKWNGAALALKEKKTTIEAIKQSYSLTAENEALLCNPSK